MSKVTEQQAKKLIEQIKEENCNITYWGIEIIPYESRLYKIFPEELKNKQVYSFELLDQYNTTKCRYYVDFEGNIYMDKLPMNGECIKL